MMNLYKICCCLFLMLVSVLSVQAQITVETKDPTGCNKRDGEAVINADGIAAGIEVEYSIDGESFQASNTFKKLKEGEYTAYVRDKKSLCKYNRSFKLKEPENDLKIDFTGTGPVEVCEGANMDPVTLKALATGGSGKYTFSWPGGVKVVAAPGKYTVIVTDRETGCKREETGEVILLPVVCARDPNDIVGPESYGPGKMIAKSKAHTYMVRFENDPKFATAPAQVVKITHPLDKNVNLFSLRLGNFGFAGMNFNVPPDQVYYTTRLNVTEQLNIVVDVIAGIDATKREAFWIFESKDPATGLPPSNAMHGFLPVNDDTGKGEGFVTYTIKAANNTRTGDSIHAKASIIFDLNGAIETPEIYNTLDAVAPQSQVTALPANSPNVLDVSWTGQDDPGGSGVGEYALYASMNNGEFSLVRSGIRETTYKYTGVPGNTYHFFTIATDNTGNQEAMKTIGEAATVLCGVEICNGKDDDCDGEIDEGLTMQTYYEDKDGDGHGSAITLTACSGTVPEGYSLISGDCNDADAAVYPGKTEICNGKDDNCDGQIDEGCTLTLYYKDQDGDGFGDPANTINAGARPVGYILNGGDCNDADPFIFPGAPERANDKDDNCNGQVDEGYNKKTFYLDADNDQYGSNATTIQAYEAPVGYVSKGGDCNDSDPAIHPGATEIANGIDDDCDGQTDEGFTLKTYYRDADNDGYGNDADNVEAVEAPTGYILQKGDCNDADATIHPGATEVANGKDDDCDGQTDEGFTLKTYYKDEDNDGYGNDADNVETVEAPTGYILQKGDCNDADAAIHPGATEVANGKDDDCDGQTDEGFTLKTYYKDADNDGYGNDNNKVEAYEIPTGYTLQNGDCNDADAAVHPGATETANGKDDNCDGRIDEGFTLKTYYKDADNDGYGNDNNKVEAYEIPTGYTLQNGDCNDADAAIHPGATEIANGKDDDCDGQTDEGLPLLNFYRDKDNDGYGTDQRVIAATIAPAGYVSLSGDCDDNNAAIHPGSTEIRNGIDDNCDGRIDEGLVMRTFYRDKDNDGYGSDARAISDYNPPAGFVEQGGDCNDNDAGIHPGATELQNGKDDDCDGLIDEDHRTPKLEVSISPVPSSNHFTIYLQSADGKLPIRISIFNQAGKRIDGVDNLQPGQKITIGANYKPGLYFMEVKQGKESITKKLIKL